MTDMNKTCEIDIYDLETGLSPFCIQVYGVTMRDMLAVPPAINPMRILERAGIDPAKYGINPFSVREARRFKP